jgi:hypothetical protein
VFRTADWNGSCCIESLDSQLTQPCLELSGILFMVEELVADRYHVVAEVLP